MLLSKLLLFRPDRIADALARVEASGRVPNTPNTWQITLGVLRMWHRMFFRSETVGYSLDPVRAPLRAKLLALRPLRFPFLLRERAIAPLDFSGLLSERERVIRHLLGAHHDKNQFVYDLEMLSLQDGALEEVLVRARDVVDARDPRHAYLRDLCVYERYHEHLVDAVEAYLAGESRLTDAERRDPDVSFFAYLAWCAGQPPTPEETWSLLRRGRYSIANGIRRPDARADDRTTRPLEQAS